MKSALARLRARRRQVLAAASLTAAAGLAVGVAGSVGYSLATGYGRAAQRADQPDVVARFAAERRSVLRARLGRLPNVERISYRLEVNRVGLRARRHGSQDGAVQVVQPGRRGYAIVAGRDLAGGADAEVLVERGVADAWDLAPGDRVAVAGLGALRVAGIALSVDNVAFPLATVPRVYVDESLIGARFGPRPDPRANLALVWLADPERLDVTLAAARPAAFGLRTEQLLTGRGVRQAIDQAAGIVIALLAVFALVACACAAAMLAAAAGADVRRRAALLGVQRALGASRRRVVGEQVLDAVLVAGPAAGAGLALGTLVVAAPTATLLGFLNEIGPGRTLLGPLAIAFLAIVAIVAAGAAWPAWQLNRRPIAALLRGGDLSDGPRRRRRRRRRTAAGGGLLALGARFAVARRGRWLSSTAVLAVAGAAVLLVLAVADLLVALRDDPATLGRRYELTVAGQARDAATIRRIPGVAGAAQRSTVEAADAFSLTEPLRVIAYRGDHVPFEAARLATGRRLRGPREVEVGLGLADALGLRPGGRLAIQPATGRTLSFRVAGIVRALENDGRVVYARTAPLLRDHPGLGGPIAIRLAPGADRATVVRRLAQAGFTGRATGAATPAQTPRSRAFLGILVTVLRMVALAIGLVCLAAVAQTLALTTRDRRRALAVLRAGGATPRALAVVLAGAAAALALPALAGAVALERLVLGPAVARLAADYATLPLAVAAGDVLLVGGALALMCALAVIVVTRAATREPVAAGLERAD